MTAERKRNSDLIIGLDVGTTKICAIVGKAESNRLNILTVSSHPSTGLRKGVVVDIDSTTDSIKRVISDAEKNIGKGIQSIVVGIAGSHIKTFLSYGAVGIKRGVVSPEDIERAIDSASAAYVPLDREILHVVPSDFIIDGRSGIKNPIGMAGSRLETRVHIITGAVTSVQNLLMCCENAGLKVEDIILEPLASAEAVLSEYEMQTGIALVDIGGGTTDIAVYKDGWLKHTAILGIGGNHFTNDIAVGLDIALSEAEAIKKRYGLAMTYEDTVDIGKIKGITPMRLSDIVQSRAEELLELVRNELCSVCESGISVSGVVLTGGSSLMRGLKTIAESVLGMPVRIGYPKTLKNIPTGDSKSGQDTMHIYGLKEEFNNPIYATGIGLALCSIEQSMPEEDAFFSHGLFNMIIERMKDWVKKIVSG